MVGEEEAEEEEEGDDENACSVVVVLRLILCALLCCHVCTLKISISITNASLFIHLVDNVIVLFFFIV